MATMGMALASAILEWSLIFMLMMDAVFSYFITKFAFYYQLQTPCILCSRLDHALGNKKRKYYLDLICKNHKSEISSLVLCHLHNKLVNVHGMCEKCLFSFATINKSNAETYRLLVGKLGDESNSCKPNHLNAGCCSCCKEPLNADKLMQINSLGLDTADPNIPLSVMGRYQDKLSGTMRHRNRGLDLSHVGYTELKINSDSESEAVLSDEDHDANPHNCHPNPVNDLTDREVQIEPHIILPEELPSQKLKKLIDPVFSPGSLLVVQEMQEDLIKSQTPTYIKSNISAGHGLEELDWERVDFKAETSSSPKCDEVPPFSHAREIASGSLNTETPASLENVPQSGVTVTETSAEDSKEISFETTGKVAETPMIDHKYIDGLVSRTTITNETNPISSDISRPTSNSLDLSDAYKLAVSGRGRQLSGILSEQWIGKDSSKLGEDLKHMLSQLSFGRGFELSINDVSPRLPLNIEELKTSDMQILQKRMSLERNESGLSLDGSIVNELEGENVVDRLKRQVEHDRKLLSALYKELEEEKNASAIAVNQAMAMITKLQEEKAALHMEALQSLRMMEEQAEYDMEALQRTNDILSQKEKEIQDLEAELEEYYSNKNPDELVQPVFDVKTRDIKLDSEGRTFEDSKQPLREDIHHPAPNFEEERLYMLRCLKNLEKKLEQFSCNELASDLTSDRVSYAEELKCKENALSIRNNDDSGERSTIFCKGIDLASLGDEVSDLTHRLEALELDGKFLEHSVNTLKNGDEGLRFVQEIASHLQELRRIGVRRNQNCS